jgi:hypothetical protein
VSKSEIDEFAAMNKFPVFVTSAKTNINVHETFMYIAEILSKTARSGKTARKTANPHAHGVTIGERNVKSSCCSRG